MSRNANRILQPRWNFGGLLLVGLIVSLAVNGVAADRSALIDAIRKIDHEAAGATEAKSAWKQLAAGTGADLLPILKSLADANPLAANYLRSAAESIVDRELAAKKPLPTSDLEAFIKDLSQSPRARRFAFELLTTVDPSTPDRLIPGMLNDPSVELRRDAVARLMAKGQQELDAKQNDAAKTTLQQAMNAARDKDQVDLLVKQLGDLGVKVDLPKHFGFVLDWKLIGPFDNSGKKGFPVAYTPEREVDFKAEYDGKNGQKVKWTEHKTDDAYGLVDLNKALTNHKGSITYAEAEFNSGKEQTVDLRLGTPNAWKIWLNGELLFGREEYHRGAAVDQYIVRGKLKPGKNVILLKVCQNEQTEEWAQRWQFQLRICDATGTAIPPANQTAQK